MAKVWTYFFVMLWMMLLIGTGVHLFSTGFLLSRHIRVEKNQCTRLKPCEFGESEASYEYYLLSSTCFYLFVNHSKQAHCLHKGKIDSILSDVNSSSEYCLPQKTRVILLVIDALKYEFGVFNNETTNPMAHENKMPVFRRLLDEQPGQSRLLKFVADAPTTTLQRLKGITTGSLPTFIDVGSNFATSEINEDNIIDQMIQSNLSAVMLGDSTWTELFPKRFLREYAFPSFDIFDLDTVDRGISESLTSELKRRDWSMLVAHYLGVDHCGHKHGPLHPEMGRKLNEMNGIIEHIVANMADDTTLFVIGDHGMTATGDHGGDSEDEVNALLFAYSKSYAFLDDSKNATMDQIDLVPSLAATLGVPIPFSNLGSINFDIVPNVPITDLSAAQARMLHAWSNVKQMRHFFSNYTAENHRDTFTNEMIDDFFLKFYVLSMRVTALHNLAAIDNFNKDVKLHLQEIVAHCREIWVKFDANQMSRGLVFTAVVNFFLYLLISNLKFRQLEVIFSYGNLTFIYLSNATLGIGAYAVHRWLGWEAGIQNALVYMEVYSIALIAFLLIQNWDYIALNWSEQKHFSNLFARIIFGASIVVFFSNSFIIFEQKILCYLVSGALLIFLFKIRKQYIRLASWRKVNRPELILSSPFTKLVAITFVAIALLRTTYSFHRCREEHGNCTDFQSEAGSATQSKGNPIDVVDLLPILVLALFATFSRKFLRKCGNLTGFSAHVLLARYGIVVAAVGCCGHFYMTVMKHAKSARSIQQVRIDAMAWIVYAIFVMQLCTVLVKPLMLFVHRKPNRSYNVSPFGRVVPQIVMIMKQMYENSADNDDKDDDIPVVYGLATVYSSVMWSAAIVFAFVWGILIGPSAVNGIFVIIIAGVLVLILNSILRYQRCTRLDFCLQPEFIAMIVWYLLGHYSFYATSHQATLSQIDWRAAFVGRTAMYDHNNIISAILVLCNTFGGQFLIFCMYPLLVMTPTALYTIYPSLAPRRTTKIVIKNQNGTKEREIVKKIVDRFEHRSVNVTKYNGLDAENDDMDLSRGELTLYENEDIFIGNVFKAGCQLLILQGIRIFAAMMACTIHCRHLMVWKIFAPRFIYEGIATYIIYGAILIGFLTVVRVHKAVNRLMILMSDTCS